MVQKHGLAAVSKVLYITKGLFALLALMLQKYMPAAVGKVLYNKEAASTKIYRNLMRHVPWDDALEAALTVAQNVQLAAHLTLPPHFTPHRRGTLVQEVLELLALNPLQHCLVGSPGAAGQQEKISLVLL